MGSQSLKIVICGIRGIPACYGGFETFAEELSVRLLAKGHQVTVYGRKHVIKHREKQYRGVNICLLPAPKHKYLETPVHTLLCLLKIIFEKYDAILVCNAANSPFCWIPRLFGKTVIINVDGIERHRAKWNSLGKIWYRLGEFCSTLFASKIVADAEVIRNYYLKSYRTDSELIRYGFSASIDAGNPKFKGEKPAISSNIHSELGVKVDKYVLYVSRLEPENNAHVVIEAHQGLPEDLRRKFPLIIVGDAPYAENYITGLKRQAKDNVIFAGYRFGNAYRELQIGARVYIQATEVGGTHPALVEAMGFGNAIIANETPENCEVLKETGLFYRKNDPLSLSKQLHTLLEQKERLLRLRNAAYQRAQKHFSWDEITNKYEDLFYSLLRSKSAKKPSNQEHLEHNLVDKKRRMPS